MEEQSRSDLINNIKSNLTKLYENCSTLHKGLNDINVLVTGKPLQETTNIKLMEFKQILDELNHPYPSDKQVSRNCFSSNEADSLDRQKKEGTTICTTPTNVVVKQEACTSNLQKDRYGRVVSLVKCNICSRNLPSFYIGSHMKKTHSVKGKLIKCSICKNFISEFYFNHHMESLHSK